MGVQTAMEGASKTPRASSILAAHAIAPWWNAYTNALGAFAFGHESSNLSGATKILWLHVPYAEVDEATVCKTVLIRFEFEMALHGRAHRLATGTGLNPVGARKGP